MYQISSKSPSSASKQYYFQLIPNELKVSNFQQINQLPATTITYKMTLHKGVQNYDEIRAPVNVKTYQHKQTVQFGRIPHVLSFYIPVYNPHRQVDFTLKLHTKIPSDSAFKIIGQLKISSNQLVESFEKDNIKHHILESPLSDTVTLNYQIFVQKNKMTLNELVKELKPDLQALKKQLRSPSEYSSVIITSSSIDQKDAESINAVKSTIEGSTSSRKFARKSQNTHNDRELFQKQGKELINNTQVKQSEEKIFSKTTQGNYFGERANKQQSNNSANLNSQISNDRDNQALQNQKIIKSGAKQQPNQQLLSNQNKNEQIPEQQPKIAQQQQKITQQQSQQISTGHQHNQTNLYNQQQPKHQKQYHPAEQQQEKLEQPANNPQPTLRDRLPDQDQMQNNNKNQKTYQIEANKEDEEEPQWRTVGQSAILNQETAKTKEVQQQNEQLMQNFKQTIVEPQESRNQQSNQQNMDQPKIIITEDPTIQKVKDAEQVIQQKIEETLQQNAQKAQEPQQKIERGESLTQQPQSSQNTEPKQQELQAMKTLQECNQSEQVDSQQIPPSSFQKQQQLPNQQNQNRDQNGQQQQPQIPQPVHELQAQQEKTYEKEYKSSQKLESESKSWSQKNNPSEIDPLHQKYNQPVIQQQHHIHHTQSKAQLGAHPFGDNPKASDQALEHWQILKKQEEEKEKFSQGLQPTKKSQSLQDNQGDSQYIQQQLDRDSNNKSESVVAQHGSQSEQQQIEKLAEQFDFMIKNQEKQAEQSQPKVFSSEQNLKKEGKSFRKTHSIIIPDQRPKRKIWGNLLFLLVLFATLYYFILEPLIEKNTFREKSIIVYGSQ